MALWPESRESLFSGFFCRKREKRLNASSPVLGTGRKWTGSRAARNEKGLLPGLKRGGCYARPKDTGAKRFTIIKTGYFCIKRGGTSLRVCGAKICRQPCFCEFCKLRPLEALKKCPFFEKNKKGARIGSGPHPGRRTAASTFFTFAAFRYFLCTRKLPRIQGIPLP